MYTYTDYRYEYRNQKTGVGMNIRIEYKYKYKYGFCNISHIVCIWGLPWKLQTGGIVFKITTKIKQIIQMQIQLNAICDLTNIQYYNGN